MKSFSPEEQSLFANIKSNIQELEDLQGNNTGEGAGLEDQMIIENSQDQGCDDATKNIAKDVINAIKEMASNGDGEDKNTSPVAKTDDGPTVDDSAEERVSVQTENNENLKEVGKALMQILKPKTTVKKSSNIGQIINKALQPLVAEVNQMKTFNANILDALGVSEKIEKSLIAQPVQKGLQNSGNVPVQNVDATAVVGELLNVIKGMSTQQNQEKTQYRNDWNNVQKSRDSLKEALPGMFQNSMKTQ